MGADGMDEERRRRVTEKRMGAAIFNRVGTEGDGGTEKRRVTEIRMGTAIFNRG